MARRRRPPRPGRPRGKKRRKVPKQVPQGPTIPDTPEAKFEEEARKEMARFMKIREKDLGFTEDERMVDRILEQHPEHVEALEAADDWTVTGDDSSPFIHIALHRIVEQRVVSREMGRLDPNVPWHDAVHAAMEEIAEELFQREEESVG